MPLKHRRDREIDDEFKAKVTEHYGIADSISLKIVDCLDLPPLRLPEVRPQVTFTKPKENFIYGTAEIKAGDSI